MEKDANGEIKAGNLEPADQRREKQRSRSVDLCYPRYCADTGHSRRASFWRQYAPAQATQPYVPATPQTAAIARTQYQGRPAQNRTAVRLNRNGRLAPYSAHQKRKHCNGCSQLSQPFAQVRHQCLGFRRTSVPAGIVGGAAFKRASSNPAAAR